MITPKMNLPAKILPRPVALSVEVSRALSAMRGNLDETGFQKWRFRDPTRAPTEGERNWLIERRVNLDAWLQPASQRVIDAEITMIFAMMVMKDVSEEDREKEHRLWRSDLLRAGMSTFGLTEACASFRLGFSGDSKGKFAPKVGEIVQAARAIERGYWKERADINAVLAAEVPGPGPSDEQRAAAVAEWETTIKPAILATALPGDVMPRRKPPPADVRYGESVPEPRPDTRPLPQLSEEALARFHAKQGDVGEID